MNPLRNWWYMDDFDKCWVVITIRLISAKISITDGAWSFQFLDKYLKHYGTVWLLNKYHLYLHDHVLFCFIVYVYSVINIVICTLIFLYSYLPPCFLIYFCCVCVPKHCKFFLNNCSLNYTDRLKTKLRQFQERIC